MRTDLGIMDQRLHTLATSAAQRNAPHDQRTDDVLAADTRRRGVFL